MQCFIIVTIIGIRDGEEDGRRCGSLTIWRRLYPMSLECISPRIEVRSYSWKVGRIAPCDQLENEVTDNTDNEISPVNFLFEQWKWNEKKFIFCTLLHLRLFHMRKLH